MAASLNIPQNNFLDNPSKFKAFVGGFGSGKTWVGGTGTIFHLMKNPRVKAGYFAPTYKLVRDVYYPTIEEVAHGLDCKTKIRTGDAEVDVYRGGKNYGTIICRTMDNPDNIVGFKIGHGHVDEIDTLKREKARAAWIKIIARMRYKVAGLRNGLDVTTTPEGFRFVHERFVKMAGRSYGVTHASTYDNELNLPDDYIESLFESYPPELIAAYINGQFTNLTVGAVYPNFCRNRNHTNEIITRGETLHIGMDFNVNKMSATVNVIRDGKPSQLDEIFGVRDTPSMAKMLRDKYPDHKMLIYPDSSGKNTSSKGADLSDFSILRDKGFTIIVNNSNPRVKSRVNAFSAAMLNGKGERNFKVNTYLCPESTECYEQQVWNQAGEPDKTKDRDHLPDAQGYFINMKYPVKKPITRIQAVFPT